MCRVRSKWDTQRVMEIISLFKCKLRVHQNDPLLDDHDRIKDLFLPSPYVTLQTVRTMLAKDMKVCFLFS